MSEVVLQGLVADRHLASEGACQQAFLGVSALLFAASAAVTIAWCASMSSMGAMPMPGAGRCRWRGRMPGSRFGAAASLSACGSMMAAMMPSLVPMLWRTARPSLDGRHAPRPADRVVGGILFV
jgi:hypothetical protein